MGTTHTRIPDPVHEEAKKVRDQHDYPSIGEAIRHVFQEADYNV